jgi:hypothetical protein
LPLFTSASSEIFRKVPDRVQIDTTLNRQNPVQNHAVTGKRSGLNRTAVKRDEDFLNDLRTLFVDITVFTQDLGHFLPYAADDQMVVTATALF